MKKIMEKFQCLLMAATYAQANDRKSAQECLEEFSQARDRKLKKTNQKREHARQRLRL
jgi:hypothetical protein